MRDQSIHKQSIRNLDSAIVRLATDAALSQCLVNKLDFEPLHKRVTFDYPATIAMRLRSCLRCPAINQSGVSGVVNSWFGQLDWNLRNFGLAIDRWMHWLAEVRYIYTLIWRLWSKRDGCPASFSVPAAHFDSLHWRLDDAIPRYCTPLAKGHREFH